MKAKYNKINSILIFYISRSGLLPEFSIENQTGKILLVQVFFNFSFISRCSQETDRICIGVTTVHGTHAANRIVTCFYLDQHIFLKTVTVHNNQSYSKVLDHNFRRIS